MRNKYLTATTKQQKNIVYKTSIKKEAKFIKDADKIAPGSFFRIVRILCISRGLCTNQSINQSINQSMNQLNLTTRHIKAKMLDDKCNTPVHDILS